MNPSVWPFSVFRKTGLFLLASVLLNFGVLCPPALFAHPHIFIEQRLKIVFDDKGMAGIHVNWRFDDMFSAMIAADHDKNKNQSLAPEEIADIKANAFSLISRYHYFFSVSIDGRPFEVNYVTDFTASLDEGKLTYEFFIPCHVKAGKGVKIASYDPEYYTAIYYPDTVPYELINDGLFTVRAEIKEDKKNLIYFDTVSPWTLFLEFELR